MNNDKISRLQERIKKLREERKLLDSLPETETLTKPQPHAKKQGVKWHQKIKEWLFPDKCLLITMELRNGFHRTFLISEKNDCFKFMGGTYVIDLALKYYSIDDKLWCLDYHQDLTMPIKKEFPIDDIKKAIKHSGICEVEASTNPHILEDFVERKVIEQVMSGQDIRELLKPIKIAVLVAAVAAVGHLLLFAIKSGMLQSVKIPGIN